MFGRVITRTWRPAAISDRPMTVAGVGFAINHRSGWVQSTRVVAITRVWGSDWVVAPLLCGDPLRPSEGAAEGWFANYATRGDRPTTP